MQENTISSAANEQQSTSETRHYYYEVGRELLAKPTLMGELAELEGNKPVLVFCNTPSDTDFVEVMLKKRGIGAQKLIGNVPAPRLERALEQIKSGELQVVVLTDIAARSLDLSLFKAAINYSVPPDVETYYIRGGKDQGVSFSKIITLVTPLELANFLNLKKNSSLELVKSEMPTTKDLDQARVKNLAVHAAKDPSLQDEKIKQLAELVLADEDREKITALLLHNTFTVIPSLRAAIGKAEAEEEEEDDSYDRPYESRGYDRDRQDRGGRQRGGQDRSRGGRRDFRRGGRGGHGSGESSERYEGLPADAYENGNGDGDSEGGQHGSHHQGGRQQRRRGQRSPNNTPPKKDVRVYLGVGSAQNVSQNSLIELLEGNCSIAKDEIKHVSVRGNCAFFDIAEEKADEAINKLSDLKELNGAKLIPCKAITINSSVPQQEQQPEEFSNGASDQEASQDPMDFSDSSEDEEFSA